MCATALNANCTTRAGSKPPILSRICAWTQIYKPVDRVDSDVDRAGHGRVSAGENRTRVVRRTVETDDSYGGCRVTAPVHVARHAVDGHTRYVVRCCIGRERRQITSIQVHTAYTAYPVRYVLCAHAVRLIQRLLLHVQYLQFCSFC